VLEDVPVRAIPNDRTFICRLGLVVCAIVSDDASLHSEIKERGIMNDVDYWEYAEAPWLGWCCLRYLHI
jgi:hypothetical protein